ncbi:MAG TPA: SRPBCC family protein [Beijerinckiaceae bacterium]|nr:SRPBCC family protein [Beijerinckiaceae bacterium]
MAPLTTSVDVARTPEDVFAYVTDPARFPEWQANVVDGRMDGKGPFRPGDRCVTVRRIGGAKRTVTSEITHIDPPRTWGVRGIDGPIRATVAVIVEPLDGAERSRLTIDLDFEGHGIGKPLVSLVVRRQARQEMPQNLGRLKQRLETAAPSRA